MTGNTPCSSQFAILAKARLRVSLLFLHSGQIGNLTVSYQKQKIPKAAKAIEAKQSTRAVIPPLMPSTTCDARERTSVRVEQNDRCRWNGHFHAGRDSADRQQQYPEKSARLTHRIREGLASGYSLPATHLYPCRDPGANQERGL